MADIIVNAGGDLQAALNAAVSGDRILLQAGEIFEGMFTLPNKGAMADYITVTSNTPAGNLPAIGVRMHPSYAPVLAKLRGVQVANARNQPALRCASGAQRYRIVNLEFTNNFWGAEGPLNIGNNNADPANSNHGYAQITYASQPNDIILDRLLIRGHPLYGQKRGVGMHGRNLTLINSYISQIAGMGQDATGIGIVNGEGPYLIQNNYIEGAAYGFITGGDDQKIKTIATAMTSPAPTATGCRVSTIADLSVGQTIAYLDAANICRHGEILTINGGTGDITWQLVGSVPATPLAPAVPGNIRWGVVPANITLRRNYFFKPVSWRNFDSILGTVTGVTPTVHASGGTFAASTVNYRIHARAVGYQGATANGPASALIAVTVGANGRVSLDWSAVTTPNSAESYRIYRQNPDGLWTYFNVGNVLTFTDTGTAGTLTPPVSGSTIPGTTAPPNGSRWVAKNAFELKSGINVQVDSNVVDGAWAQQGGAGFALWVKAVNQNLTTPFNTTRNVTIENNLLRNIDGFLHTSGVEWGSGGSNDDRPRILQDVAVRNNLIVDSGITYNFGIYAISLSNGCRNLIIENNTVLHHGSGTIGLSGSVSREGMLPGLIVRNNLFRRETYGVKGGNAPSTAEGTTGISAHSEGQYTFVRNVLAGASQSVYPPDNFFPSNAAFEGSFENYAGGLEGGNFRLRDLVGGQPNPYKNAGTNGLDLGANIGLVIASTAGVEGGAPAVPPTITTNSVPGGTVGQAYSQQLQAQDGTAPYAWDHTGVLPAGITLSPGGLLSGTPTASGNFSFTARVVDALANQGTRQFTLAVTSASVAPVITTTQLPTGRIADLYHQTLESSSGTAPLTWTVVGGSLPPGLTLTTDGVITGVPTLVSSPSFNVRVTAADGLSDDQALAIIIEALPQAPPPSSPILPRTSIFSTRIAGSLYNAATGQVVTSGRLRIRPKAFVPIGNQYAPYVGGIVAPTTIVVDVPATGQLDFNLIAPVDVTYVAEYDPTPEDESTPIELKAGYFQSELTALTNIAISYEYRVMGDNPMAYWRMGETVGDEMVDSTGNGHNGRYSHVVRGATSVLGGAGAAWFNGSNSEALVEFRVPPPTRITIEAFARPDTVLGANPIIGTYPRANNLSIIEGRAVVRFLIDGSPRTVTGSTPLLAGAFYHLVATYDGDSMRLYVNGVLDGMLTSLPGNIDFGTQLFIARDSEIDVTGYESLIRSHTPNVYWHLNDASGVARELINGRDGSYLGTGFVRAQRGLLTDASTSTLFQSPPGGRIEVVDHATLNFPADFSVEMWHRNLGPTAETTQRLLCKRIGGVGYELVVTNSPGGTPAGNVPGCPSFGIENGGVTVLVKAVNTNIFDSEVNHIVGVRAGNQGRLYINGILVATGTVSTAAMSNAATFVIGRTRIEAAGGLHANGYIQDVALYGRGLTDEEISQHYQQGTLPPAINRFAGTLDEVALFDRSLSATDIAQHYQSRLNQIVASDISQLFAA